MGSTTESTGFGSSILRGLRIGSHYKMKPPAGSNGVGTVSVSSDKAPLVPSRHVNSPVRNRRPPSDWCFSTYFIFILLGVGHLLPWNFFITAQTYFEDKFTCHGNVSACSQSLSKDFENYFSVAAMLTVCVMTLINIFVQSLVHYRYRMFLSLVGIFVLFSITAGFVLLKSEGWVDGFFAVTIATVIAINVFSAIFQSSTFGFSGIFPPKYTTAVMGGQGIAGIAASLALIFSKLASSNHPTKSALIYFCLAVVFISICLVAFLLMMRMGFVKHHLTQTSVEVKKTNQAIIKNSTNANQKSNSPPFLKIFRQIFMYAISVYLVFTVTLSLFPAVLSQLKSSAPYPERSGWTDTYFNPLVCFLMFNSSDFCGRFITQWVNIGRNRFVMFSAAVLRFGFVPLFLLCNLEQSSSSVVQMVFDNDAVPVVLVGLMGFTNGYLGSLAMMTAPSLVSPEHRETGGTIMVFFLSFGLLTGSSLSFIWTKAILKIS